MSLNMVLMLLGRENNKKRGSSIHYDSVGVIQDVLAVEVVGVCLDKNTGLSNLCKLFVYPYCKAQIEHKMNILAPFVFAPPEIEMCRTGRLKNR